MKSQGLFPESGDQWLLCSTSFTTALVSVYMLLGYTATRACAGSRSLIQFTRLFFLVRGWSLGTLSWGTFYDWTSSLCQSFLSIVRKNQKYKSIITDLPFTSCVLVSRERTEKYTNQKMHTGGRRWKTNTSQVTSIKEKITISNHKVMLTAESKVGARETATW